MPPKRHGGPPKSTQTRALKVLSPKPAGCFRWLLPLLVVLAGVAYYYYSILLKRVHVEGELAFKVVDLPGKGKGMVALRDIEQGELLIREMPLFTVPLRITSSPTQLIYNAVSELSPSQRALFLNLSFVNVPEGASPEKIALGIFQTNGIAAGEESVGLFPMTARLNHGCSKAFNAVYSWREKEGVLVVYVLKRVKAGEELLTAYTDTKKVRSERRAYLSQTYGFHCMCEVCALPDEESEASDERLTRMDSLLGLLSTWTKQEIDGKEAIRILKQVWNIGEQEGYWSKRGRLAGDATLVSMAHEDAEAVIEWAQLAARWFGYELGEDSEQVQEMLEIAQSPRRHWRWGTREKMDVGGPVGLSTSDS